MAWPKDLVPTEAQKAKISAKAKARWSDPAWLMKLAQQRLAEQRLAEQAPAVKAEQKA